MQYLEQMKHIIWPTSHIYHSDEDEFPDWRQIFSRAMKEFRYGSCDTTISEEIQMRRNKVIEIHRRRELDLSIHSERERESERELVRKSK